MAANASDIRNMIVVLADAQAAFHQLSAKSCLSAFHPISDALKPAVFAEIFEKFIALGHLTGE